MPKQMSGQEGGLGKPLAGQKRDLGKRLALKKGEKGKRVALEKKMRGAGEMVAGRMATRSVTRALSNAKRMDKRHSQKPGYISSDLNICADMTVSEGAEMHGASFSKDPYEGRRPFVNLINTEKELEEGKKAKGSQDPLSSSESDELLLKMFLEWAKKLNKNYNCEEEKKKRFLIWCSTKKRMDERHSHKPGYISSDLNVFADMTESERAKMHGGVTYSEDPFEGRPPVLNLWKTKKGLEEVKKAVIEFEKWVEEHKRNYGSRKEREKKFLAFLDNKRRIDTFNKVNPGCWTHGYNLDNMDKFFWESKLIPSKVAPCKGCSE